MQALPDEIVGTIFAYLPQKVLDSIAEAGIGIDRGVDSRQYWRGKLEILLGIKIPNEVLPLDLQNVRSVSELECFKCFY